MAQDKVLPIAPRPRGRAIEPRPNSFPALGPGGFTTIHYVEWGPPQSDRTVVCVHGLTRNSRDFDFLARHLAAAGMRVVAVDLPGRGRSAWIDNWHHYGTALYVAVVGALISRLGVDEVDYVGTSLGGHIGIEVASLPRAPIRRLVLNDIGARVAAPALQRISDYLKTGSKLRYPTIEKAEAHLRDILAPFGDLTDAQWRHLAEHSYVTVDGSLRLSHDPAISKHFWLPMLVDITLWQVWEKVSCPTLVLRGEHSDLLSRETVRQMERRGIAASRGLVKGVEIAGCGHAPALMAADQMALIADFLTAGSDSSSNAPLPLKKSARG